MRSHYLFILTILFSGCELSNISFPQISSTKKDAPKSTAIPEQTPMGEVHRAVNGEFLKELYKDVLERELVSEDDFAKHMNVLDQGGHYEGIYNSLIYSAEYRQKEKGSASIPALKIFSEVATELELSRKYDPLTLKNAEKSDDVEIEPSPVAQASEEERKNLQADYEKKYLTYSTASLKKKLGEEVLKTIDLKKEYREKFASWYGHFTSFLNLKKINFGFPARNRTDEYYHYQWALHAEEDRIKWECLHRVHVLMNTVSKK